ncbi:MAG: hypothetical protein CVU24_14705 [Betaproteobacteria bacterium HGW-Betaproteobacteria-18]|nr:MAG: hypothetical protein CVU73_11135 [Deltaproteobacteria bacterium HGW-Deltaproteobacteria-8]PKO59715.1 MAG: hypothetical protein CVU24_14705 [Betaproteobacteria bacterium HGW-Betaproteobacteria-18]
MRDALLAGVANGLSFIYSLLAYVRLQTRISTATDGFLDMIAGDFLGDGLPRKANQTDASYRARIIAAIFRERGTRKAIIAVLTQLTGRAPVVFEPLRPKDTGAYGLAYGYGSGGGYGTLLLPFQAFVTAFRPSGGGVANVAPYGVPGGSVGGGYGVGSMEQVPLASMQGQVTDADIFNAIESVRPAGYTIWARISS